MKTLFLLLIYLTIYAANYPTFTKHELNNIEHNVGQIAKNRINNYTTTIASYQNIPINEQLIKVNYYLNEIIPNANKSYIDIKNHWTTPKEFLTLGLADCEDYAIIKYFTLLKLGVDKDKLFMTVTYDKYSKRNHMVLSYFKDTSSEPLILDNLSFKVLNLKKRNDLKVDMFVNTNGVFKLDKNSKLIKIANGTIKFKELLKRVEQES